MKWFATNSRYRQNGNTVEFEQLHECGKTTNVEKAEEENELFDLSYCKD